MVEVNRTKVLPQVGVTHSGGGFRAISRQAGSVDWACKHVHFTDRSARNCAELHLKTSDRIVKGATA